MCADHVWRSIVEGGCISRYFEQPHTLGLVPEYHTQKVEGVKLIALKINFYFFARAARSTFLARHKFLRQTLITYKTFGKNRFSILFLIFSKNIIVENGLHPPTPHFRFSHGCLGTRVYQFLQFIIFTTLFSCFRKKIPYRRELVLAPPLPIIVHVIYFKSTYKHI